MLRTFFDPVRHGVARDAEGPGKPPQARSLLVGSKDLLAPFVGVAVWLGVLAGVPGAILAQEALLFVRGHSVSNDVFAAAMAARNLNSNHGR